MAEAKNQQGNASVPASPARAALVKQFADFAEATLVDLPVAGLRRIFRDGGELEMHEAGWKAYDSALLITNGITTAVMSNPTFGALVGRGFETIASVQRLNSAIAGAVFATLSPALGAASTAEVQALRDEVRGLRGELRVTRLEIGARDQLLGERMVSRESESALPETISGTDAMFQIPRFAAAKEAKASERN